MTEIRNSELDANIARAVQFLERFRTGVVSHVIGGRHDVSASGETFETLDPATNARQCTVASGGTAEIDRAARAAAAAFKAWRSVPGARRRAVMHDIADAIVARADEIALVESSDTGQPIRYMAKAALRGAENFRYYADLALNASDGQSLPDEHHVNYTMRQPLGPVGVITPWNTPFMLSTWKIAPALAAGCTVVHKPAEWSPLSAVILTEIMDEVIQRHGYPAGVVNLVHGLGETAGKALTEHADIKAIAFVGETTTGSHIMRQGAATLKRVHFELGGKNPVIVFDDAELDRALDAVLFMIYSLNGERCTSSSRALVQRSIYASFSERAAQRVRSLRVGHPLDPATEIGPLIHPRHCEKVLLYPRLAREDGARVAVGGERAMEGAGNYVQPTLYLDASTGMRIAQEEIFGPALTMIPFEDEADAIRIANGTDYGLAAGIWTRDGAKQLRVGHAMRCGQVFINSYGAGGGIELPFGGVKKSGHGREKGFEAIREFTTIKTIVVKHG